MPVEPALFETYEAIILSGQMSQADVPSFLDDNAEFANWYRERIKARTMTVDQRPDESRTRDDNRNGHVRPRAAS